ncbi:OsmC family protein [Rothia kristinae]|uniref:OsmC family protein n=1 Tax=Rothia kristinae TaxID=37923 RepID=UPI0009E29A6C|nr:OsmC family protein [Rothia kristinae]
MSENTQSQSARPDDAADVVASTDPASDDAARAARTADPGYRSVTIERIGQKHYRAVNAAGATLDFGQGEGLLSPVELLLAATAGCSAVDVDVVTSRRTEPESFAVEASAIKGTDETGGARLNDVELSFRVRFPDDGPGRQAERMVPRLVALSHDKDCTVSRTVEHPTSVTSRVE